MTARTRRRTATENIAPSPLPVQGRMVPAGAAVTNVVVRVVGIAPVRLDLTHVGTAEQRLGLTVGMVLIYVRSGITVRNVAEAWGHAAVLAQSLSPAIAGRRPLVIGPSTVGALVQLAGIPEVTSNLLATAAGQVLQIKVGPVTWELCDANAYTSLLRAWRQAARLIEDNPTEDDDYML